MDREPIPAVPSRSAYLTDADVTVRVQAERPPAGRKGDEIQEGSIDRLVLVERGSRVVEAHVLDFKTDAMAPGDDAAVQERTRHYRPQIEAYREVIRERYGIEGEAVRGTLVCLAGWWGWGEGMRAARHTLVTVTRPLPPRSPAEPTTISTLSPSSTRNRMRRSWEKPSSRPFTSLDTVP